MAKRYNPPPNWPAPPEGWSPGPGWQPDPAWGPPPSGWKLYVDDRNWFMRHKILTGLLGLVLLGIISSALGGGKDSGNTSAASDNSGAPAAAAPAVPAATTAPAAKKAPAPKPAAQAPTGLNKPVRDGNFEFTVKSVKCGIQQVGTSDFGRKAQGQFCFVKMHVANIGSDSQMLDGSSQNAYDSKGRKFSADTESAMYMGQAAQTFLNDINPGNAVDGTVIFDVPKNVKITQLELHDSAFSGGVKVKVG
ncbi:DUF4352 domain-containing protein [Oryzihumus sp.]